MEMIFKKHKRLIERVACLALSFFLMTGCMASKNMGGYQASDEVRQIFESYQVLPDHHYYYSGSNVKPSAIIAIDKHYILTSDDLWKKEDVDSNKLKFWVETMMKKFTNMPHGFYILNPAGKRIGFYYSYLSHGPVEMEGNNRVSVYLPEDDKEEIRPPARR